MGIDYSRIVATYDHASFRAVRHLDSNLLALAALRQGIRVLDLACGTGTYISVQKRAALPSVEFVGMDLSTSMLSRAKMKGVTGLVVANADLGLPFVDESMDYVVCRFGFHHFRNKVFVLEECWRCLRGGGVFHMFDVDPHRNKSWWIYNLFPEVAAADRARFLEVSQLLTCLTGIGFEVSWRTETGPEIMTKYTLLERLRIRDSSQLHMIDETLFESRYREVESWPEDRRLDGDYAFLAVTGKKT